MIANVSGEQGAIANLASAIGAQINHQIFGTRFFYFSKAASDKSTSTRTRKAPQPHKSRSR